VSPIRDADGAARGAICLFSDLTDIVELEEQLRLKDSLAQVGELTAGIAHEFRNGLATIHGYARLLDLERLPADMPPYVKGIRDETDALGAVVRNFLTFAKPAELVLGTVDAHGARSSARPRRSAPTRWRAADP
jgi:signal transduction histidine kinase